MKRRVFDTMASAGAIVVVIVLVVAGSLLLVAHDFADGYVHTQLAEQRIRFPPAAAFDHPDGQEITSSMIPSVSQYAGQQLVTGAEAQVYANDFIAVHLQHIGGGKTYAQLSAAAMALPKGSPAYVAAEAKVQSVFQRTTLRGLLLEAYGFSLMAAIARWSGFALICLAGVLALFAVFGFLHARATDEDEELLPPRRP